MKIGLTYDLRSEYLKRGFTEDETAEFDREETLEALESALEELSFETERIGNIRDLTERVAVGEQWFMVFNIAEGLYGYGREAQVPALLEAFRIPYVFSDPLVLSLSLHKGMTKRVVQSLGIATPQFCLLHEQKDLDKIKLPYPLFLKPVAEGTSKGVGTRSKVESPRELQEVFKLLIKRYRQPVLVEEFLPGREFTTGILGTGPDARAVGTLEIEYGPKADAAIYTYRNKEECEELVRYSLVPAADAKEIEAMALRIWREMECRDAGRVDIRMDARGKPSFLELNPLPGLHPLHSDLPILCTKQGISYKELIRQIIDSAQRRSFFSNVKGVSSVLTI